MDFDAIDKVGKPNMTSSYVAYLITTNLGVTANIVFLLLWNYDVSGRRGPGNIKSHGAENHAGLEISLVVSRSIEYQTSNLRQSLDVLETARESRGFPEESFRGPGHRSTLQVSLSGFAHTYLQGKY
jgi:hypothetical protein